MRAMRSERQKKKRREKEREQRKRKGERNHHTLHQKEHLPAHYTTLLSYTPGDVLYERRDNRGGPVRIAATQHFLR